LQTFILERKIHPHLNTITPSTTSTAAIPSRQPTASMPLSVVFTKKKLTIGWALQTGAATEAGAWIKALSVMIEPIA
jgi:hypothetical protein